MMEIESNTSAFLLITFLLWFNQLEWYIKYPRFTQPTISGLSAE